MGVFLIGPLALLAFAGAWAEAPARVYTRPSYRPLRVVMCSPTAAEASDAVDSSSNPEEVRAGLKEELIEVVTPLGFGFDTTPEQRAEVLEIIADLEEVNPTPEPLQTPDLLSGQWRLLYTSSQSVRNVKGVMGVNQWFRDARMKSFVQDLRCEPNYVRYVETVEFPDLVSKFVGKVAVAEGFWTEMEDEPRTMYTEANKVTVGPMKYDSDQWQSLRCLMVQEITYLDDTLRIQHGLVPDIVFVFERLPDGANLDG